VRRLQASHTGKDLLRSLEGLNVSEDALVRMDELIDARKQSLAQSATWDLPEVPS